jgi:spore maturation protein CgeB
MLTVFADSPQDFRDKIDYYLNNEDERTQLAKQGQEFLLSTHTNFHRIADILRYFECEQEAENIITGWNKTRSQINV